MSCVSFSIVKSFARLELIPAVDGLRLRYLPVAPAGANGAEVKPELDVHIPLEAIGGLWTAARAFSNCVECLDETIILGAPEGEVIIKLYRDKPKGERGSLTGQEVCWLRLVTGRGEEERRRIKLGPRDLLSIDLACQAVLTMYSSGPLLEKIVPVRNTTIKHHSELLNDHDRAA